MFQTACPISRYLDGEKEKVIPININLYMYVNSCHYPRQDVDIDADITFNSNIYYS